MSLQQIGARTYANIKDLPQIQDITDGDFIIVHTNDGTSIMDFANFKIDLPHTTFEDTYVQMVEFVETAQEWVTLITNDQKDILERTEIAENNITDLQKKVEALERLIIHICVSNKRDNTELSSEYTDILEKIREIDNTFSFDLFYLTAGA